MPGRTMMKFRHLLFPALLTLAACGGDKEPTGDSTTNSVMAGNWSQDTGSDAPGMTITFDGESDKISVHLAPRADGTHDHAHGKNTYSYDDKTKALTVNSELLGDGKGDTWTGTVAGDGFEIKSGETTLKFKKGGEVKGH